MDDTGYIKAGEDGRSSVPGIYAVGDVRTKQLRQVVTAAQMAPMPLLLWKVMEQFRKRMERMM